MARRRGQIWQRSKNLPAHERAKEKARAVVREVKRGAKGRASALELVAAAAPEPDAVLSVTVHGQPLTVNVFDLQESNGDVSATLAITDQAGAPVPFSNPLIVRNHPVEVPDGTFYEFTDEDGVVSMAMNMVEDPAKAFRLVVEHTLAVTWWQGEGVTR